MGACFYRGGPYTYGTGHSNEICVVVLEHHDAANITHTLDDITQRNTTKVQLWLHTCDNALAGTSEAIRVRSSTDPEWTVIGPQTRNESRMIILNVSSQPHMIELLNPGDDGWCVDRILVNGYDINVAPQWLDHPCTSGNYLGGYPCKPSKVWTILNSQNVAGESRSSTTSKPNSESAEAEATVTTTNKMSSQYVEAEATSGTTSKTSSQYVEAQMMINTTNTDEGIDVSYAPPQMQLVIIIELIVCAQLLQIS